jgi:Protein of unknown function (DUF4239)
MNLFANHPWHWFAVIWLALLVFFELGIRLGRLFQVPRDEERLQQTVSIRDALMVLLSLLLGFTLAMALPRYDHRRELVVDEANAIGTTYLRAASLPQPAQDHIRDLLRRYVNARIEFAEAGLDQSRVSAALRDSKSLQDQLWSDCMQVTTTDRSAVVNSFMVALNETIDLDAKRQEALANRIPGTIWVLIFFISTSTVITFGCTLRLRFALPMVGLPLMIAMVISLIADLDSSRSGTIKVSQDTMQHLKIDLSR